MDGKVIFQSSTEQQRRKVICLNARGFTNARVKIVWFSGSSKENLRRTFQPPVH